MYTWILVFFYFFTVFLKNKNMSSKIKIAKVTDYAALKFIYISIHSGWSLAWIFMK